jgi:uncharacterized protein (TIGR03067 family)
MRKPFLFALGVAVLAFLPLNAADKDKEKEPAKLDPAKLIGKWDFVSGETDGKKVPEEHFKNTSVEITKDVLTLKTAEGDYLMKYKLDVDKSPCRISLEITKGPQGEGAKAEGIIALKDGELKLCYPPMGGDAPKEFAAKEGSKLHFFVLKAPKK